MPTSGKAVSRLATQSSSNIRELLNSAYIHRLDRQLLRALRTQTNVGAARAEDTVWMTTLSQLEESGEKFTGAWHVPSKQGMWVVVLGYA